MTGFRPHIFGPSSRIVENQLFFVFIFLFFSSFTDLSQLTLDRDCQTHSLITERFNQLTHFIRTIREVSSDKLPWPLNFESANPQLRVASP